MRLDLAGKMALAMAMPLAEEKPFMSITLHADPVPLRVDETSAIRVGQSRVSLDVLLQYWRMGMKPEEIARGLDTLSLADVHGALACYLRHDAEIDEYLRRRADEAEKLREQIETANAGRLAPLGSGARSIRSPCGPFSGSARRVGAAQSHRKRPRISPGRRIALRSGLLRLAIPQPAGSLLLDGSSEVVEWCKGFALC
jgi:uncharacterized protein (DUF433 family)